MYYTSFSISSYQFLHTYFFAISFVSWLFNYAYKYTSLTYFAFKSIFLFYYDAKYRDWISILQTLLQAYYQSTYSENQLLHLLLNRQVIWGDCERHLLKSCTKQWHYNFHHHFVWEHKLSMNLFAFSKKGAVRKYNNALTAPAYDISSNSHDVAYIMVWYK